VDEITQSPQTRPEIVAEQDEAAGGRDARRVSLLEGGRATASISLSEREDGYSAALRFKAGGRTFRRTIGKVTGDTRAEVLRRAWDIAKERNFLSEQ
jgi:DNA mismatch endonuclease (patch repair protein)